MKKDSVLPEWFESLKYRLEQSWLRFNVDDVARLSELSQDQVAFFMEMVKVMQGDLPESQLAEKILSLGSKEVEEKVTAIDVVISKTQTVAFQVNTIHTQVNLNPIEHVQNKTVNIGVQNNYHFFSSSDSSMQSTTSFSLEGPFTGNFGLPPEFEDFMGREDSLALLEYSTERGMVISHPKKTVSGTGGVGKTQLVSTFAHRKLKEYRETEKKAGYRSIIWFIAGTDEGINNQGLMTEQMHRLGQQLGIDSQKYRMDALVKLIFQQLDEQYGPYLVVYDNAFNYRSIKPYLPPAAVPLIITTRNGNERDWDQTFKAISLGIFSPAEAHAYIKKVLCRNHADLYCEEEANALAKALGYFPLALTQALAYITTENIRITEYLAAFVQQKEKYLLEPVPQGDPYQEDKNPAEEKYSVLPSEEYDPQKATVWAVVQLSLKKVINADAHQILKACAYLAPEVPIDTKLLAYWTESVDKCHEAVRALRQYSLLGNSEVSGYVRIHKIVQEVLNSRESIQDKEIWWELIVNWIEKFYNNKDKLLMNSVWKMRLLPHLTVLHSEINREWEGTTQRLIDVKGVISFYLGCLHNDIGDNRYALAFFEEAKCQSEKIFPPDHPELARILTNLGSANNGLGNFELGISFCEEALRIKESKYGKKNPELVSVLINLANAYSSNNNIAKAKNLCLRAIEILEEYGGKSNPDLALLFNNLGTLYFQQMGQLELAKKCYEQGIAVVESTVGHMHEFKAKILSNLSDLSIKLGHFPKAKGYALEALKITESLYGVEHQLVCHPLMALGSACLDLGHPQEGLKHYKRALSIQERLGANNTSDYCTTIMNIGLAHQRMDKLNEAEVYYKRAIEIMEANAIINLPLKARLFRNLGTVYLGTGDRGLAVVFLENSLGIEEEIYADSPLLVETLLGVSKLCKSMGLMSKSITYFNRAEEIEGRINGGESHEDSMMKLMLLLSRTGVASQEQLLQIAQHCIERELVSEALFLLEFVLNLETSVSVLLLRARCQLQSSDFGGANETASLCQALSDNNGLEVKSLLSEIERKQQQAVQWEAKIATLQSHSVLSSEDQITLAVNFYRLNRYHKALEILVAVIASKPSLDMLAPAYYRQAQCFFGLQRYEEALKSCEESYRLNEHPNVQKLITKIEIAIEVTPKLNALIDQLTHVSSSAFTI